MLEILQISCRLHRALNAAQVEPFTGLKMMYMVQLGGDACKTINSIKAK